MYPTWHHHIQAGMAASALSTYLLAIPTILWFFCWLKGCQNAFSLVETVSAYGYSTSVLLPLSFLWMFVSRWIQLGLLVVGAVLSGGILSRSFAPVLKSPSSSLMDMGSLVVLGGIVAIHALFGFLMLLSFFS